MSGAETRGWVAPLAIGVIALGAFGCLGFVLIAGAGALVWLAAPSSQQAVSGPVAIYQRANTQVTPSRTPSPLRVEGSLVYADVSSVEEPAPARFAAALPVETDGLDAFVDSTPDSPYPPYSHVSDLACGGDVAMGRKVLSSVREFHRSGATASDIEIYYGGLYRYCDPPAKACPFLLEVVTGSDPAAVKSVFWNGLEECRDPAYDAAFDRADTPASAYIRRLRAKDRPWSKRLEQMAAQVIKDGAVYEAREAAFALGATDDARVAKALLAIHAEEPDESKKRVVALALYRQTDPAAAALFKKTCDAGEGDAFGGSTRDPICDPTSILGKRHDSTLDPATATLEDLLGSYSFEVEEIVAANEKTRPAALADALERCGDTYSEWQGRRCLSALAAIEWKRAAAIAARMSKPEDHGAAELRQALRQFDDRPSLIARLRKDGVLAAGDPVNPRVTDVRVLLTRAGRLHEFDAETGAYPNEHDSLLRSLAVLARPELDGIVFLETPPALDEETGEDDGSLYELDAWLGGRKWHVDAKNDDDWYDVERCVGLLNRILEERGSRTRLMSLRTEDQTAAIVAGDKDGLERLARDRLLVAADPSAAAGAGKAFEQQAIDALQREEESR